MDVGSRLAYLAHRVKVLENFLEDLALLTEHSTGKKQMSIWSLLIGHHDDAYQSTNGDTDSARMGRWREHASTPAIILSLPVNQATQRAYSDVPSAK